MQYSQSFDNIVYYLTVICLCAYLLLAVRRFYNIKIIPALLAAIVIGGSFFYFVQLYRMLLFYKIIYLR